MSKFWLTNFDNYKVTGNSGFPEFVKNFMQRAGKS